MNVSNLSKSTVTPNPVKVEVAVETKSAKNIQTKSKENQYNQTLNKEKQQVKNTVEKLNDFFDPAMTNLKFIFHEDLHEYYVTVVDPITNEVLREIPPKKMLDMYAAMTEFIGVLVDEKI